ncbi:MAG: acetate--CoA ligase family protein, partial [Alphaproteobacteria bacterium]
MGGAFFENAVAQCDLLGFDGPVWGVNPKRTTLGGQPCFPSVADLPTPPDATFVGVPREATIEVVAELARIGAGGAICYATGFAEVGGEGLELQRRLVAAAGELAVVGPNCYGVLNLVDGVSMMPIGHGAGRIDRGAALISQSGNLSLNVTMNQRSVPLAFVISCGNQAQLEIADYIDVLIDDARVTAIGLYLESIRDVPRFAAVAARALGAGKPIVAFKLGVSEVTARLALSHTDSLVGSDALYDALFRRLGVARITTPAQLLETLKLLSTTPAPAGDRLAVFTCSGGDSGTAADLAGPAGVRLPQPNPRQTKDLRALLPDFATINNPLDYNTSLWGKEKELTDVFGVMLSEGYDAALLIIDYPRETLAYGDTVDNAIRALVAASRRAGVPGATCSVFAESVPERARAWILSEGVAPLQGIENGLPALGAAMAIAGRRRAVAAGRMDLGLPVLRPMPATSVTLDEAEAKRVLAAHGVPVPDFRVVPPAEVPAAAANLGFPVAVKALDRRLAHKTELGAVALNLADGAAVAAAVARIGANLATCAPGIALEHVLVEAMVADPIAELIVGVKRDPAFGLVLVVGAGGVLVELVADTATLLLPTTRDEVARALDPLKVSRLLKGFRGRPAADPVKVVDAVLAIAD